MVRINKQKNKTLIKIIRDVVNNSSVDDYPQSLKDYIQENDIIKNFIGQMDKVEELEDSVSEVLGNPKTIIKAIFVSALREANISIDAILEELKVYTLRARKNRRYKMANRKEGYIDFTSYDPPTKEESPLNTLIAEEELTIINNVIQEEKEKVECVM